ncbi:hypothetical protein HK105_203431 [Polyrhizophydium stewartii]|uniref:Cilia- and flagella-associated protein 300 n=1 Tax=Polyrhizophydium stewartii TaxID=2732419 RepID=A0ABR4NC35_9FUNG
MSLIQELPDDFDLSTTTAKVVRSDGTEAVVELAEAKPSSAEPRAHGGAGPADERATGAPAAEPQHGDAKQDAAAAAGATAGADRKRFTFTLLQNAKFAGFDHKDTQALLFKWGMQGHCYIKRYAYDQYLEPYNVSAFLVDFFNDNPSIAVLGARDSWGTLGRVASVEMEPTAHTVTSLDFFDRLTTKGVIRESTGEIKKCLDEYVDSFLVSDELRKCLLMPEYELYDIFTENDRREFIFHVFKAICLGGRLCQFEDELGPYLDVTKKLYKDLITVVKDPQTGRLRVASLIFKIKSVESSVSPLFPFEHPQNFCYVSIDPIRRHVNLWYHASDAYY